MDAKYKIIFASKVETNIFDNFCKENNMSIQRLNSNTVIVSKSIKTQKDIFVLNKIAYNLKIEIRKIEELN